MLLEERTIFAPGLGKVLVECIVQGKEDFGRLVDDVICPVNEEPDDKQEHRADRDAHSWGGGPQGTREGPTLPPASSRKTPELLKGEATAGAAAKNIWAGGEGRKMTEMTQKRGS